MNNNDQSTCNNTSPYNDYNCVSAVEQVYPADIIDNTDNVKNLSEPTHNMFFDPQSPAANDAYACADIYSLNSARQAKHNRSMERRANKCQLTDRRSADRLCVNGEVQKDRRADNRVANIESIRRLNSDLDYQRQKSADQCLNNT